MSISLAGGALRATPAQATTRVVYLSATDGKGTPVTDLATADITVKDDGKAREVLSVERASGPLSVALLIDDNGYGANDVRNGVAAFAQRLRGLAEISMVTTAGQNVTRVDYTTDFEAQFDVVRQLYVVRRRRAAICSRPSRTRPSRSARGRRSAARWSRSRSRARSSARLRQDRVLDALRQSGASLSVIAVGKPVSNSSAASPGLDENMNRNKVIGDGPKQSGGRHEEMVATAGCRRPCNSLPTIFCTSTSSRTACLRA